MKYKTFTRIGACLALLFLLAHLIHQVEASFTSPLNINFSYPLFPSSSDPSRVGGSGMEQVFRSSSVPASGVFANLDPKNGIAPAGTTLDFFVGNAGAIGANDFVYAFKITNSPSSTLPLFTFQTGSCQGSSFTSIGYVKNTSGAVINPTNATFVAFLGQLFFTFDNQPIPPGQESAILFFTSPDPPSLATSFIGGGSGPSSVSANIDPNLRLYSPCPVSLTTDKKIGCTAATVSDNALVAVTGSPIVYQVSIQNNGQTPLSNIVINDPQLGGNISSQFFVNNVPFTGTLSPGQTAIASIPATATASVSNTVTVAGEYLILTQQGTPTGQSLPLAEVPAAKLSDSTTLTVLPPPSIQAMMSVMPTSFTALPQTLTYTLKATNNGTADLATMIDVDAKLKGILLSPPPGLSIPAPPTFPASQPLTAGAMTQIQFSITVNSVAGWLALADAGLTQATFMMTAKGTLAAATADTCGTTTASHTSSATTTFTPPCTISLEKTIACDAGNGVPPDTEFTANALVYPNSKVYYRYKITNTSLLDSINNLVITDPAVTSAPINVGTLIAGEMKIINLPIIITHPVGPIPGTAIINGVCVHGEVSAQASADVRVIEPKITAQKLVNGVTEITNYQLGTELKYTLIATNDSTSGIPLDLTIDDALLKVIPGVVIKDGSTTVTLPYTKNVQPGNSVTVMATVTFATQEAFRAASDSQYVLRNTLQVSAAIPNGAKACSLGAIVPSLTQTAEAIVRFIPPPEPEVCIIRLCEPNCPTPTPGQTALVGTTPSSTKPGSLLFYNIYTSAPVASQDTALTLTNLGPQTIFGHVFLVDGRTCTATDFFSCLSPNQTSLWLASELDPGVTGYMIVVAVNESGLPISFNYLMGSSKVKFSTGHQANLSAMAFAAQYPDRTVLPGLAPTASSAELKLDGIDYNLAPQVVAVSNFASPADKNSALLIVNPVGGDLSSGDPVNIVNGLIGQVITDKEKAYSFTAAAQTCQLREVLSDKYPRIPFGLSRVISSGVSGSMRFSDAAGVPLMGSIINYNPDVKTSFSAFNQGHNLHHLTYTDKAKYIIPIFRPHS